MHELFYYKMLIINSLTNLLHLQVLEKRISRSALIYGFKLHFNLNPGL